MAEHNTTYLAIVRTVQCSLILTALSTTDALAVGPTPVRPTRRTPAAFTRDIPLSEAIDILRNATTPPLNIVVYWKDLRTNAGIDRDTTIGFDGPAGLRLRQYLEILLSSLSATSLAPIGYAVDRGVVVIATEDTLPKRREITRVYDVTDLLHPPSRPSLFSTPMLPMMMYGGIPRRTLGTLGPYGTPRGRTRAPSPRRR